MSSLLLAGLLGDLLLGSLLGGGLFLSGLLGDFLWCGALGGLLCSFCYSRKRC